MINKTKTTVDRTSFTITFQRAFAAPRDDVFDAWTDPEQIKRWWDPTGISLAECTVDLRPGGAFCFTAKSGHAPSFAGVYRLIERPAQLVFDAMGAVGTVQLESEADTTRMTVRIPAMHQTSIHHAAGRRRPASACGLGERARVRSATNQQTRVVRMRNARTDAVDRPGRSDAHGSARSALRERLVPRLHTSPARSPSR
jgi:uncharacterized protein YndB with AHSA1/START domain